MNNSLSELMPKLRFYSIGGWGDYGYSVVEIHDGYNIVNLYSNKYKIEPTENGFSISGTVADKVFETEYYDTIDEVCYRLFKIHRSDYKKPIVDAENNNVWFNDPHWNRYENREKGGGSVPYEYQIPKESDGVYGSLRPDFVPVKITETTENVSPLDIAYKYFPRKKIKAGWSLSFELNVCSNKIGRYCYANANTMIINPKLYYTINGLNMADKSVEITDTMKGCYDMVRYDWIIFDETIPEDIIVVYSNQLTSVGQRAFVITENGYALHPLIEKMGYVLEIGDVSERFD